MHVSKISHSVRAWPHVTLPNPANPCVTLSSDNKARSTQAQSETLLAARISWPCYERWLWAPEEVQWRHSWVKESSINRVAAHSSLYLWRHNGDIMWSKEPEVCMQPDTLPLLIWALSSGSYDEHVRFHTRFGCCRTLQSSWKSCRPALNSVCKPCIRTCCFRNICCEQRRTRPLCVSLYKASSGLTANALIRFCSS